LGRQPGQEGTGNGLPLLASRRLGEAGPAPNTSERFFRPASLRACRGNERRGPNGARAGRHACATKTEPDDAGLARACYGDHFRLYRPGEAAGSAATVVYPRPMATPEPFFPYVERHLILCQPAEVGRRFFHQPGERGPLRGLAYDPGATRQSGLAFLLRHWVCPDRPGPQMTSAASETGGPPSDVTPAFHRAMAWCAWGRGPDWPAFMRGLCRARRADLPGTVRFPDGPGPGPALGRAAWSWPAGLPPPPMDHGPRLGYAAFWCRTFMELFEHGSQGTGQYVGPWLFRRLVSEDALPGLPLAATIFPWGGAPAYPARDVGPTQGASKSRGGHPSLVQGCITIALWAVGHGHRLETGAPHDVLPEIISGVNCLPGDKAPPCCSKDQLEAAV